MTTSLWKAAAVSRRKGHSFLRSEKEYEYFWGKTTLILSARAIRIALVQKIGISHFCWDYGNLCQFFCSFLGQFRKILSWGDFFVIKHMLLFCAVLVNTWILLIFNCISQGLFSSSSLEVFVCCWLFVRPNFCRAIKNNVSSPQIIKIENKIPILGSPVPVLGAEAIISG